MTKAKACKQQNSKRSAHASFQAFVSEVNIQQAEVFASHTLNRDARFLRGCQSFPGSAGSYCNSQIQKAARRFSRGMV